jgi:catechol 2,3-dioxygenase-like lactoylglutathione lyase family enzyme
MNRRKFITKGLSFSALIALHLEIQSCGQLLKPAKSNTAKKSRFPEITLSTSKLEEQYEYYSKVLEFKIIKKTSNEFSIEIGESILKFIEVKDGSEPFYHFAINIPTNKYLKAQKWLASRTPVLMNEETGGGILYFDFWDAHAMYFKDPAGNIGELIARHTLSNEREGEFGISDMLYISEIGTPVEDPKLFAEELKSSYGLDAYGESMFIGDETGMFVIPPTNRLWFPENIQRAGVYPTEIVISDKGKSDFKFLDYPYKIKTKN